ncbi:hypothetical protein N9231_02445 [Saprospiraceae bacterium]|nr:hypothetical protein [Saprospiraceae bacterium]
MKTLILIPILSCLLYFHADAKIWRVNNALSVPDQVDFNELKDAVEDDAVMSGDTIYLEASSKQYAGDIHIQKSLTIIGNGYLLSQGQIQPSTANKLSSTISASNLPYGIFFDVGSDNSTLMGVDIINTGSSSNSLHIGSMSNIVIQNNRLDGITFVDGGISNVVIRKNLITDDIIFSCSSVSSFIINVFVITNNLINGEIQRGCSSDDVLQINSGIIYYNTFASKNNTLDVNGCDIQWNYVGGISLDLQNQNIMNNKLIPGKDDNEEIVASFPSNELIEFEFDAVGNDIDDWILELPYLTTTHGAYNGADPLYSDDPISKANLPGIPIIYESIVPALVDTTLNVQLKVRTNQ